MGCSPCGRKESDMTERLHFLSLFNIARGIWKTVTNSILSVLLPYHIISPLKDVTLRTFTVYLYSNGLQYFSVMVPGYPDSLCLV